MLPGVVIGGDFLMLIVNGDGIEVGFDGELAAHVARGHAVAIAVKRQREVFVNAGLG